MGDHIFNRVLNRLGIYSLVDDKDSDLRLTPRWRMLSENGKVGFVERLWIVTLQAQRPGFGVSLESQI